MARRSDHSHEEIRELALAAAEQIIVEQGPGGLTARKVASEIGYTVGTIYLVFENLDDLIMHINARTLDRLHQLMTEGKTQNLAPKARLIRLGQIYIHFAYGDPHRWVLIFEHHLPEDRTTPDWYAERIMRVFAVVEKTLQPLAPHRKRKEISQAARALWAGIHGICILGITQKLGNAGEVSVLGLANALILNYLTGFTNTGKTE
jgi:AcrR family transcriptional regulator